MKDSWLVDLHVHTPASDDYRGAKEEAEYIQIVKMAKENNIDVIGITDHFSVKGYRKLMQIYNEKQTLIELLDKQTKYEDSPLIQEIKEEIELFESVLILMGIEINISPGIHYIIIFSKNVDSEQVEKFLLKLDIDLSKYDGSSKCMIEINSIEFFKQVKSEFGEECIIYAPHANQSSGVIKTLKGIARQNILQDKNLTCIGFNQDSDRKYIKEDILSHIKRERELAFIQDSDYHAKVGQRIGEMYFYIENQDNVEINFNLVRDILNGSKFLKTSCDTDKERYEKLIKNKIMFQFNNDNLQQLDIKEGWKELAKTFCAVLNSGDEKHLIEIEGQVNGELNKEEVIENYTDLLMKKLIEDNFKITQMKINKNIRSKSKVRLLFGIGATTRLSMYEDKCYIINREKNIEIAKASDIEAIVAKNMHIKFGRVKDFKMKKIADQCISYSKELLAYSLVYKLIDKISFMEDMEVDKIEIHDYILSNSDEIRGNGEIQGEVILIEHKELRELRGGRLSESYLRVSAPTYNLTSNNTIKVDKNSILIVPGGGVYLVNQETKIETDAKIICLKINNEQINIKVFVAYLKSSIFQWMISKNYMKDDIYNFLNSLKKPIIPIFGRLMKDEHKVLEEYIDELIDKEITFVNQENSILKSVNKSPTQSDVEKLTSRVNLHNREAEKIMKNIDYYIYEQLELCENEQEQIVDDLKRLKIYCWE